MVKPPYKAGFWEDIDGKYTMFITYFSSHLLILCNGATNKAGKSQWQNDQKSPLADRGCCLLNLEFNTEFKKTLHPVFTLLVPFSAGYSSAAPAASIRVKVATVSIMMGMYWPYIRPGVTSSRYECKQSH